MAGIPNITTLTLDFDAKPFIAAIEEVVESRALHRLIDVVVEQGVIAETLLRTALDEAVEQMKGSGRRGALVQERTTKAE